MIVYIEGKSEAKRSEASYKFKNMFVTYLFLSWVTIRIKPLQNTWKPKK